MKSRMKMEDRILSALTFGCYVFALIAYGVVIYALVTLFRTAYGNLGQVLYLTASQF